MKKNEKYLNWISKNIDKNILKNTKNILISGATGSIGSSTLFYISKLSSFNIFLLERDLNKGNILKEKIEKETKSKITLIEFDYLSKELIDNSSSILKDINIDIFINISGIYHQKEEYILGIEKTYLVNLCSPIYFITSLLKSNKDIKIIIVSSISYSYSKLDFSSLNELNKIKSKTKRYILSKRLLMNYFIYYSLINKSDISFVFPGVTYSSLFSKDKNGYNRLFYFLIVPLMKIIFMKPSKCSLSIIYSTFNKSNFAKASSPKGLLNYYGYPKFINIKKDMFDEKENKKIFDLINEFLEIK